MASTFESLKEMIGKTLSHYRIADEISRGGMGIVYRAVDTKLGREVALKVLPPELLSDPGRRERFVTEARSAAALENPHIAVIYEIDEAEGQTFIAMELIRGEKLSDLLGRRRIPPGRALELAIEIAEGLAHAHDRGIAHRDLKPANVMATEDGHAKIIDFGIAKLIEPRVKGSGETTTSLRRETEPGVVLGTVSYMSPEQARAERVDHRSDVFSFGVLVQEMLTGDLPFQGKSAVETLNAILKDAAPRLPDLPAEVPPDAVVELQRILDKCLSKDPKDRYQSMKDVVVDLRAVWRRLQSGPLTSASASAAVRPRGTGKRVWLWVAAAILLAATAALIWSFRPRTARDVPVSTRPSVAVLYFENNTGDPSLDWLRTALTDMLVTDLSQSPAIEILGTDSLYQILKEMNQLDERVTSLEVVREIADRAKVDTVLLGSFIKAGDTIRINVRLQEAASGRILTTERVEGQGESSIFPMVDDLTRRIQSRFDVPLAAAMDLDRNLAEVTTSSLEAYRWYAEGIHLHDQLREEEAVPLLERAIEIDPDFGMAFAKLAIVQGNLNHPQQRDEYARRALEHADRLTARERYYVEGIYNGYRPETIPRAIEAYRSAVESYPDMEDARHNLALIYAELELFDEAAPHLEELKRRGMTFPDTYSLLAQNYVLRGDSGRAIAVLQEYLRSHPESAAGHMNLADLFIMLGRFEEAEEVLARAESLDPGSGFIRLVRLELLILRERWTEAETLARSLQMASDPFRRWAGSTNLATIALEKGRLSSAIQEFEKATTAFPEPGRFTSGAHFRLADLLLATGDVAGALEHARKARKDGAGDWPAWWAIRLEAVAEAKSGRWEEAERLTEDLKRFAESMPGESFERDLHWLRGELARLRGETETSVRELGEAVEMLPSRAPSRPPPPHASLWFSYAEVLMAVGREDEAALFFQRITNSTSERVRWPLYSVRSLYFLGKLHEKRGEMDRARDYYRRFVDRWRDGDLDRERVQEALSKL